MLKVCCSYKLLISDMLGDQVYVVHLSCNSVFGNTMLWMSFHSTECLVFIYVQLFDRL